MICLIWVVLASYELLADAIQQAENKGGHRPDWSRAEPYDVFYIITKVMAR